MDKNNAGIAVNVTIGVSPSTIERLHGVAAHIHAIADLLEGMSEDEATGTAEPMRIMGAHDVPVDKNGMPDLSGALELEEIAELAARAKASRPMTAREAEEYADYVQSLAQPFKPE